MIFRTPIAVAPLLLLSFVGGTLPAQVNLPALARTVTVHRDEYGVPHVVARTDAGAAFGFAYAQAEDNFWRVEENYIRALGRASEIHGDSTAAADVLNRTLDIPRLARRDYARLDAKTRALCDGFAAGLNFYIARNPSAPRLLKHVEPWYPLALIRYLYYQNGFANDPAFAGATSVLVRTAHANGVLVAVHPLEFAGQVHAPWLADARLTHTRQPAGGESTRPYIIDVFRRSRDVVTG